MADDQSKSTTQKPSESTTPSSRDTVKFITAATIGFILLVLSGITLTGTVLTLIIATPIMVLFSPILVPVGIILFLTTLGFLFSGAFGVVALSALAWLYNYVAGKNPQGSEQLDYTRLRLAHKARDLKERAQKYGEYVQDKAQEASQTQTAQGS